MLALLLLISSMAPVRGGHAAREALTTVAALQRIGSRQASQGIPVRIEAQITFVDTGWAMMFVRDPTGSAFVRVNPKTTGLAAGELAVIEGRTAPGAGGAFIVDPRIQILGKRALPAPIHLDLAAIERGDRDSSYIMTQGILRPATPSWQHTTFQLVDGSTSVPVFVPGGVHADILRLTGALVTVKGISGDRLDGANRRVGANLWVQSTDDVQPLNPGWTDMMKANLVSAADLENASASQETRFEPAAHLRGRVIWQAAGQFVLEDATGAITVKTPLDTQLQRGDLADVVGFPQIEDGLMNVEGARVRISGERLPVPPTTSALKWTLADALRQGRDGDAIRMSGRVISESRGTAQCLFRLEDRSGPFEVAVGPITDQRSILTVAPGSTLDATGILRILPARKGIRPRSVLLLVDSPSEIVVRDSHALSWREFLLACAILIFLAALLWAVQMRGALRAKTELLRVQMEQEAQLENRYRRLFERNLAAVFSWRPSGEITECNQAFARMLGFGSCEEVIGKNYWSLQSADSSPREAIVAEAVNGRQSRLRRLDGSTVYLLENITAVKDKGEDCYETVALDVTELKRAQDAARHEADIDALTGLPNRRRFSQLVRQQMQAGSAQSKPLGLLYLDLDGFKAVNDTLGHATGDWILRQVASRLGALLSAGDCLCRIGGDEFAVLLTRPGSVAEPREVALAMLESLDAPFQLNEQELMVGASVGISTFPEPAADYEALMQQADSAMYLAKRTGRNRAVEYTPEIGAGLHERNQIVAELKGAAGRGEISVVYQPEFGILDRRLLRFEALARWRNRRLGSVPPAKFIPVAEENGLIGELSAYVLETACRDAVAWQQKTGQLIAVGVNVSTVQLRSDSFIDTVVNTLKRTGLSPSYLELEMTESIMLDGLERCQRVLTQLRAVGVRLTLDDFGTGYSSLSYLPELPFERLKIDRSFLAKADRGRGGDALIASIISVAHTLGMSVVAEGIETPKDLHLVSNLGADELQGYLLGRPDADPCSLIAMHFGHSHKQTLLEPAAEERFPHAHLGAAKA